MYPGGDTQSEMSADVRGQYYRESIRIFQRQSEPYANIGVGLALSLVLPKRH